MPPSHTRQTQGQKKRKRVTEEKKSVKVTEDEPKQRQAELAFLLSVKRDDITAVTQIIHNTTEDTTTTEDEGKEREGVSLDLVQALTCVDEHGVSAVDHCLDNDSADMLKLLLSMLQGQDDISVSAITGCKHYFDIVLAGRVKTVELLLAAGYPCDTKDEDSCTVLQVLPHSECDENQIVAMAELLLEHGADINACGGSQACTPLLAAVNRHCPSLVAYLLTVPQVEVALRPPNAAEVSDDWCVTTASIFGICCNHDLSVLKALLASKNVDANMQNETGDTALTLAVQVHGCNTEDLELSGLLYQACVLLLADGADPETENGEGEMALTLTDDVDMLELFEMSDDEIERVLQDMDGDGKI